MSAPRHDQGRTKESRNMPPEGIADMSEEEWQARLDARAALHAIQVRSQGSTKRGKIHIPKGTQGGHLADY